MEKSVITDTKVIIEKINDKMLESNKKYYNDVLEFINMLFNDESKSILKVKLKQISLSEDVLEIYNYIIKKHGIKKDLIDIKYFDFDIDYDTNDVIKLVILLCNNLFEKISYQMFSVNSNGKKILKIKMI